MLFKIRFISDICRLCVGSSKVCFILICSLFQFNLIKPKLVKKVKCLNYPKGFLTFHFQTINPPTLTITTSIYFPFQKFTCIIPFSFNQIFRSAFENNISTFVSALWSDVYDPICTLNYFCVVFDNNDRMSRFN